MRYLLMVIVVYLFRFSSLFMAGGGLHFWLFKGDKFSNMLITLGMALFMWGIAKLISFVLKINNPRFLNTRAKRIIAAVICILLGLLLPFDA